MATRQEYLYLERLEKYNLSENLGWEREIDRKGWAAIS